MASESPCWPVESWMTRSKLLGLLFILLPSHVTSDRPPYVVGDRRWYVMHDRPPYVMGDIVVFDVESPTLSHR
jgi:hypothetical protein